MANPISTQNSVSPSTSQRPQFNQNPNQKSKNRFHGKPTGARTGSTSNNQLNQNSRNAKRARWAKKNKPTPKPVFNHGPVKEYICDCHGEPATKPRAGTKVAGKDPETGKMKDKFLGLGKWRCSTTRKRCKVTPRAPQKKETAKLGADFGLTTGLTVMLSGS